MYALKLFSSKLGEQSATYQQTLTQDIQRVEQTRRRIGGDWSLDFDIVTGDKLLAQNRAYSEQDLLNAFNKWLGYEIQEHSTGAVWSGFIAEMELTMNGMKYKRSLLENYCSHVRAKYDGGVTGWVYSDHAAQFGRRDVELSDTSKDGSTAAEAFRNLYLTERSYPRIIPVGVVSPDVETTLHIGAVGYIWTAEWQLMEESDVLGTRSVSDTIAYLISKYCVELEIGHIESNTRLISQDLSELDAWQALQRLVMLPGPSGERYVLNTRGHLANYVIEQPDPTFFVSSSGVSGSITGEPLLPRQITPGVFRHLGLPALRVQGRLAYANDFVVDEVVARGDDVTAGLRLADANDIFGLPF